MSRDCIGKLGLTLASVLVCLVFGELLIRWLRPAEPLPHPTTRTDKSRLYGWAPVPGQPLTFVDPETGGTEVRRANAQGWRDVEHGFPKPPGRIRIVFVGDSFTYGSVPLDALYTRRVEAKLRERSGHDVEVLSIGVGGWGPDQQLEVIRNEVLRYAPDLVVYQFCSNDLINLDPPPAVHGDMSLGSHKPFRYLVQDGALVRIDRQTAENSRSGGSRWHALLRRSALFRTAASLVEQGEPPRPRDPREDRATSSVVARFGVEEARKLWQRRAWALLEALVREMDAVSRTGGARFLVFSESGEQGMRDHLLDSGQLGSEGGVDFAVVSGERKEVDMELPLRYLARICERNGIPLIAPKRTYQRYRSDWHSNRAGNENMANDIVEFLEAWPVFQRLSGQSVDSLPSLE